MLSYNLEIWKSTPQPCDETKLIQLEKEIRYTLPQSYKDFLTTYQAIIHLQINYVTVQFDEDYKDNIPVCYLDGIQQLRAGWNNLKDYEVCKSFIPIGGSLGTEFWAICLDILDYGTVYLFSSDLSKVRITDSFLMFLDMIVFTGDKLPLDTPTLPT